MSRASPSKPASVERRKRRSPSEVEDEAQSQRFIDLARKLEAEGDIDPGNAEAAFERVAGALIKSGSGSQKP